MYLLIGLSTVVSRPLLLIRGAWNSYWLFAGLNPVDIPLPGSALPVFNDLLDGEDVFAFTPSTLIIRAATGRRFRTEVNLIFSTRVLCGRDKPDQTFAGDFSLRGDFPPF
jgi:hypothetical protein